MQSFDAVVLGLGTMGSFACLELARRGLRVAGIDQFHPPHHQGSHSGETRVFRVAYAEHPAYVPLAQRAAALWNEHGIQCGYPLLTQSGMLSIGPPESSLISGIKASSAIHNLAVDAFSHRELQSRFPAFSLPESYVGIFERTAGWIDVDSSIRFAIEEAERCGATLSFDTPVAAWRSKGERIILDSLSGPIETSRLVITAGAWSGPLLQSLELPLSVRRKVLVWVDPEQPELFRTPDFPVFAISDSFFYGFPQLLGQGVKLAIHWGQGGVIKNASSPIQPVNEEDLAPVMRLASEYLPALGTRVQGAVTCLYTMTEDEHFLVDRHPFLENVFIAAGFSGHGFKFAPAIGEALADMCTTGHSNIPPIFSIGRFPIAPQPAG